MDDKITIIEGPPPIFEDVHEGWPLGLNESPSLHKLALTRLRTLMAHRWWSVATVPGETRIPSIWSFVLLMD